MRYLQSFEFIDRVDVLRVTAEVISLRVVTRSSRQQLADLLSVDGVLRTSRRDSAELDAAMALTWAGER